MRAVTLSLAVMGSVLVGAQTSPLSPEQRAQFHGPYSEAVEPFRIVADRHHACAGGLFHRRVALHMVEVRVAGKQDLDILQLESQLLDIGPDDGPHLPGAGIDHDVALRRRQEI